VTARGPCSRGVPSPYAGEAPPTIGQRRRRP
jgi:hypothetical protein